MTFQKASGAESLRMVLIGKAGVGKSTTGNSILGRDEFKVSGVASSVTCKCEKRATVISSTEVHVIDTPGLFDTTIPAQTIQEETGKCIAMSSPGPHVILLLLSVGRFTQEESEAVKLIQEIFGEEAKKYIIVCFTRGDFLEEEDLSIEQFIQQGHAGLKGLIEECGGRYHVFNNKGKDIQQQVNSLLKKVNKMIRTNGGSFYTTAMFEETERQIRAEEKRLMTQNPKELPGSINNIHEDQHYEDPDTLYITPEDLYHEGANLASVPLYETCDHIYEEWVSESEQSQREVQDDRGTSEVPMGDEAAKSVYENVYDNEYLMNVRREKEMTQASETAQSHKKKKKAVKHTGDCCTIS